MFLNRDGAGQYHRMWKQVHGSDEFQQIIWKMKRLIGRSMWSMRQRCLPGMASPRSSCRSQSIPSKPRVETLPSADSSTTLPQRVAPSVPVPCAAGQGSRLAAARGVTRTGSPTSTSTKTPTASQRSASRQRPAGRHRPPLPATAGHSPRWLPPDRCPRLRSVCGSGCEAGGVAWPC